eukprot:gene5259-6952_t
MSAHGLESFLDNGEKNALRGFFQCSSSDSDESDNQHLSEIVDYTAVDIVSFQSILISDPIILKQNRSK